MACTIDANGNVTCGTGGWDGPLPGDPDMGNILLQAAGTYGGNELSWTWPTDNSGAVAHTIVWRSLQNDFDTAFKLAIVQGDRYLDRVDPELETNTRYYYWVQMVSINNTVGDVIGPASAVALPLISQMLTLLTNKINAGQLNTSLKSEIDQIGLNKLGITAEELARAENDQALAVSISEMRATLEENTAVLQEEIRLRVDADSSFVEVVNTMYAEFNGNVGAVQESIVALASELESVASTLTTVNAQVNGDSASGQVGLVASVSQLENGVTQLGARYTAVLDVNGLIGGFGIYNDGTTVEAGFNVNRFWVGSSASNKIKPFIIEGGTTYIDDAAIRQLVFTKLRSEDGNLIFQDGKLQASYIAVDQLTVNDIQSNNYVANTSGWAMRPDGTWEMNGNASGGRMQITPTLVRIYDGNGVLRVRLGVW